MEAREYEQMFEEVSTQGDPRLLFANFTSSLLIVNSTLLTYAALGLLGLAGLAYLFYFLTTVRYMFYMAQCHSQYSPGKAIQLMRLTNDVHQFLQNHCISLIF